MTVRDAPAALAPQPVAPPDWATLLSVASPEALADVWLAALWPQLPHALRAVVLLDDGHGQLRSAASLPRGGSLDGLAAPVGRAAASGQPLLERIAGAAGAQGSVASADRWIAVQPAVLSGRVRIAVCAEFGPVSPPETAAACAAMQWGLGWLAAALAQRGATAGGDAAAAAESALLLERSRRLFDLTLAALSQPSCADAGLAVVNALAQRHDAALVQLGRWRDQRMRVEARSGAAWHDRRSQLVQLAERAMTEAADDGASVRVAPADHGGAAPTASLAYAREAGAGALAIVLLRADDQLAGALMLERQTAFDDDELASLEAQALLLGPVLHTRHEAERGLWAHARASAAGAARSLTGSTRPALATGAALAALLLAGAALWPVTWRITAPSTVEGEVQRAAVAPFQGFIRAAQARAGDTVQGGPDARPARRPRPAAREGALAGRAGSRPAQGARGDGRRQPRRPAPGRGAGQPGRRAARPDPGQAQARRHRRAVRRRDRARRPVAAARLAGRAGQGAVRAGAARLLARHPAGRRARHGARARRPERRDRARQPARHGAAAVGEAGDGGRHRGGRAQLLPRRGRAGAEDDAAATRHGRRGEDRGGRAQPAVGRPRTAWSTGCA